MFCDLKQAYTVCQSKVLATNRERASWRVVIILSHITSLIMEVEIALLVIPEARL